MSTKEATRDNRDSGPSNSSAASGASVITESGSGLLSDSLVENVAKNEHGNRKFDAEKVARIKAQIASGSYAINPASIVSRMIEHNC